MWKLPEGYGTVMDPSPIAKVQLGLVVVIISAVRMAMPMLPVVLGCDAISVLSFSLIPSF